MAHTDPKPAIAVTDVRPSSGFPGSASSPHPTDAIPLPAHGFEILDDAPVSELGTIPAADVIT